MEVKGPKKDEKQQAGDLRLPEIDEEQLKGPSRGRAMLHLTGIGLGFVLLLVGVSLGLSLSMWSKLPLILVIAGGALVAGWITINHRFLVSLIRNRRVLVGTNAMFMAALAVVLVVMVNFISFRHYRKWDMTQAKLFTLSQKTENVLKSLDKDVAIIVFRSGRFGTGEELTSAKLQELLRLYTGANGRIKVEYPLIDIDPEGTKVMVAKYNIEINWQQLRDVVYVVCGAKKKVLRLGVMMDWDYFGDQFNPQKRPLAFKGEQFITSALVEVTEERQTKIYALTGHGESGMEDTNAQGMSALSGLLKWENIAVEALPGVPAAGVPQDCDCLMILAPQSVLARDEVDRIRRYIERGGKLLVCEDVKQTSGLEDLLAEYGVRFGNNVVVSTDPRRYERDPTNLWVYEFGDHEISSPLKALRVRVDYSRSIETAPAGQGKFKVTPLLETTKDSYRETDVDVLFRTGYSLQDETKDKGGPVTLAAAVEETQPKREEDAVQGKEKKLARIVVFGDADVFANHVMVESAPNIDLCRYVVNWLVERKDLVAIESRPEMEHIMAVDEAAKKTVFLLLVIALPLVVLLVGGMVWALRSYGSRAA